MKTKICTITGGQIWMPLLLVRPRRGGHENHGRSHLCWTLWVLGCWTWPPWYALSQHIYVYNIWWTCLCPFGLMSACRDQLLVEVASALPDPRWREGFLLARWEDGGVPQWPPARHLDLGPYERDNRMVSDVHCFQLSISVTGLTGTMGNRTTLATTRTVSLWENTTTPSSQS